ncbi:MAG: metal-dependent phosphohydrolase [Leptolyngbyaceae cyanobacterium]
MLNPAIFMKQACVHQLQDKYNQVLGRQANRVEADQTFKPEYAAVLGAIAIQVLNRLSSSTALYHNVEHTILVCLVGQEILHGKHQKEGNVTCTDWLNFMVSLLCHDIGYVGGVCLQDDVARRRYRLGQSQPSENLSPETAWINLAPGATDASLSPYHVDRSLLFVQENLGQYNALDLDAIQQNIDLTRFPVPNDPAYRIMDQYPGLARAADLIGQLSDSSYLQKTVALFYEFEEAGVNQRLGYHYPEDLKWNYPSFYRTQVYPYIQPALTYLQATPQGCQIIENLEANVAAVEQEQVALKAG